jgi:hypothetical protein
MYLDQFIEFFIPRYSNTTVLLYMEEIFTLSLVEPSPSPEPLMTESVPGDYTFATGDDNNYLFPPYPFPTEYWKVYEYDILAKHDTTQSDVIVVTYPPYCVCTYMFFMLMMLGFAVFCQKRHRVEDTNTESGDTKLTGSGDDECKRAKGETGMTIPSIV